MSKPSTPTEAIAQELLRSKYRNSVDLHFRRYGSVSDKQGRPIKFDRTTGIGPVPTVTQAKMFAEYDRCQRLQIPTKILVLKPRQGGASVGAQHINYFHLRKYPGRKGAIMADTAGTSAKLFEHFRRSAEHDDFDWGDGFGRLTPDKSLAEDITLPGGSQYIQVTAGSNNAGRGGTLQCCNLSEVAFFTPNPDRDPALAFLGSLSKEGPTSVCIMDSTPNGPQGTYWTYWSDEKSGFTRIFVSWFEEPSYCSSFENDAERRDFERTMDEDERDERNRFGVSLEQLKWRRQTIHDSCAGDPDKFRQEYPSDPIECFLRRSRARFSITVLENIQRQADVHPPTRGELSGDKTGVVFQPDEGGSILVYEQPRLHCRYIGALDSCTGRDQQVAGKRNDPDEHAARFWRDEYIDANGVYWPPKLVASHSSQLESETVCEITAMLSWWFGGCLVVPEVNACGLFATKKLIELGAQVYYRKTPNSDTGSMEGAAGWNTNVATRKVVIDNLGALISRWTPEKPTFHNFDRKGLNQYRKFIVNKTGHPEAAPGEKDDLVLADAIALYNIKAATEYRPARPPRVDLTKMLAREGWVRRPAYR